MHTTVESALLDEGVPQGSSYESEIASISGHLAVLETFVLPQVRQHVPHGRHDAKDLRRQARGVERDLRMLQGRLHGDQLATTASERTLDDDIRLRFAAIVAEEQELGRRLDASLGLRERIALAARVSAALHHAPTRPHPWTAHPRGLARAMFGFCRMWDAGFDAMEGRVLPGPPRPPSRPMGPWGRYVAGAPQFRED